MRLEEYAYYLNYKADRKLSVKTISSYLFILKDLSGLLNKKEPTIEDVRSYITGLRRAGRTESTIAKYLAAIRGYFSWKGQSLPIRSPKKSERLPRWLNPEEVGKVLSVSEDPRDQAMIMMAYSCALRPGELLNLKREDLDLKAGYISLVRKGGKNLRLKLEPRVLEALKNWLLISLPSNNGHIFPIGLWTFRRQLQKLCRGAGVKIISPHELRHSRATALVAQGVPLPYIQRFLGHTKLDTTAIYLHITDPELEKKIVPAF